METEGKKEITLEEQKNIQLELLGEFKKICDNNNLNYFLGGGTLLGAIRHKGYIPWDDDIDVMMPRKDYQVLLEIFNQNCKNNHKLLTYENTKGYYYSFAKIVNTDTRLEEGGLRVIDDMGIYIDVFPIDFLPDDEKKTKRIFVKYSILYKFILMYKHTNISEVTSSKAKLLIKKVIAYLIVKLKLTKKISEKLDKISIKYNNTGKVACISGRYAEKEIMPELHIQNYKLAEFEGEKYKIPTDYDEYLTKHYGNYMELPPEEKRKAEHNNVAYWR